MNGPLADVRACAFDAYGTLLDLAGAVAPVATALGPRAAELLAVWRTKQIEYTWLRTLMQRHAPFSEVTEQALDYAAAATGVDVSEARPALLQAFRQLPAYPDARGLLETLGGRGLPAAVLSNGTPDMLEHGLTAAGLRGLLRHVLSVESVGVYKPRLEVYQLALRTLGVTPSQLAFVSANAWDAAGAATAGLRVIWVNRAGAPRERLPHGPVVEVSSLAALAALFRAE